MVNSQGMILFAHGARDPRWAQPFEAIAQALRSRQPRLQVQLAYLEFMSPTLPEAAEALAQQGVRQLHVLPLFLGAGGHVRKDLPELIDRIRASHPQIDVQLHPAIGEQAAVIQAMAEAAAALLPPPQAEAGHS